MTLPWARWEGTITASGLQAGSYRIGSWVSTYQANGDVVWYNLIQGFDHDGSSDPVVLSVRSQYNFTREGSGDPQTVSLALGCRVRPYGTPKPSGAPEDNVPNPLLTFVSLDVALVDYEEDQTPPWCQDGGWGNHQLQHAAFINEWTIRVTYLFPRYPTPEEWSNFTPTIWDASQYTTDDPSIQIYSVFPAADGFFETRFNRWNEVEYCLDLAFNGGTPGRGVFLTGPAYSPTVQGIWAKAPAGIWTQNAFPAQPLEAYPYEVAQGVLNVTFNRPVDLGYDPSPFDLPAAYQFEPPGPVVVSARWIEPPKPIEAIAVAPHVVLNRNLELQCSGIARGTAYTLWLHDVPPRYWRAEDTGVFSQRPYPTWFQARPGEQPVDVTVELVTDTPDARARVQNDLALIFSMLQPGESYPDSVFEDYFANQIGTPCKVHQSTTEPAPGYRLVLGMVLFKTAVRLLDAALALLPPGRSFSKRRESMLARVLDGLCLEPERVAEDIEVLRSNLAPHQARDPAYVDAWEEALGITEPTGTLPERALAVADKLRGQAPDRSLSAYQAAATARGMTLTALLENLQPFRAGASMAGDAVPGDAWAFVFFAQLAGGNALERASLRADYARRARAHTLVVVSEPEVP